MSDEPKIKLTTNHPEMIACGEASKALRAELDQKGVTVAACGVGLNKARDGAAVYVYLVKGSDAKNVPTTYQGYEVCVTVTGQITPA